MQRNPCRQMYAAEAARDRRVSSTHTTNRCCSPCAHIEEDVRREERHEAHGGVAQVHRRGDARERADRLPACRQKEGLHAGGEVVEEAEKAPTTKRRGRHCCCHATRAAEDSNGCCRVRRRPLSEQTDKSSLLLRRRRFSEKKRRRRRRTKGAGQETWPPPPCPPRSGRRALNAFHWRSERAPAGGSRPRCVKKRSRCAPVVAVDAHASGGIREAPREEGEK